MRYLYARPRISVVAFIVLQSTFTASVFAAGFQINEISPSLQGDATAGAAAATNDVSSMFTNPATLATLNENQAYLGGSGIFPHVAMSDARAIHQVNVPGVPPSSIIAPVQGKNYEQNISSSAFVPDAYLGWRINNKMVAGLGINAPYGLTSSYSQDSVVRFAAIYSSVKAVDINPALAYSINEKWSIGAGLQAQYLQAKFSNFNGPYTGIGFVDELTSAEHPTYLKGDGWGYGYNLGLLFRPDSYTRLGIGYRSQISEKLTGHGQQYTMPGGTVPAPSHNFLFNAQTGVSTSIKTPQVLTFSAARDIANWTLKTSLQINFWDVFNQISIDMPDAFATNTVLQTHWKNTWFSAVGAEYRATPKWTVRGGVAYDETPTINLRDPRIPDANRVWLNLGATYVVNKKLSIDGAYGHIFMQNQKVNVTEVNGRSATSTEPLEVNQVYAKYKGSADVVALALRYRF